VVAPKNHRPCVCQHLFCSAPARRRSRYSVPTRRRSRHSRNSSRCRSSDSTLRVCPVATEVAPFPAAVDRSLLLRGSRCRRPKSLAAGSRCRRPKSLAARYTLGGVAPSAATEVTACFATPRPTRPTEVVRIGAASPTRPTEVGHVEATDVRCTQPLLLPTRGSVGEGAVRSEDQQAHPRGPRPFHCRCSGRCAARDVLSRVFGAPMARSAPALLAHRSAPAGLAAPEGAALLDPKASLTRLSPSRPARPAPLATRR